MNTTDFVTNNLALHPRNIFFSVFVILPSLGERPSCLLFLYTSIAIAINTWFVFLGQWN